MGQGRQGQERPPDNNFLKINSDFTKFSFTKRIRPVFIFWPKFRQPFIYSLSGKDFSKGFG